MASKSPREVKRRIRSVANTQKITKALETVSAVKMRKAQAATISGRPFAEEALRLLRRMGGLASSQHPLLQKRDTGRQLLIVMSPDKGLTGSLGSNLIKKVVDLVHDQQSIKGRTTDILAIGNQAEGEARREGLQVIKSMRNDVVSVDIARTLRDEVVEQFVNGPYDKVILAFTQFESTLKQRPFVRGILPITPEKIVDVEELPADLLNQPALFEREVYELEPSANELLADLIPDLVTMLLYHALLESSASEHSARMVAMKNAHDNAEELIEDLTLQFNRLRQESITSALAEISAGVAALDR